MASIATLAAIALPFADVAAAHAADGGPTQSPGILGGDACPWDLNGDAVVDAADLGLLLSVWGTGDTVADFNGDGTVDGFDLAGVLGRWGPCEVLRDCNGNALDDAAEIAAGMSLDCNGDLIPDDCQDCDGNGVADACEIASGAAEDCNGNGVPDACDVDCDGDGTPDACAIAADPSIDCDGNGVPDACDIAFDSSSDCDGDGVLDACAIASGAVEDCDGNGSPDGCDADCDGDGVPDHCAIAQGLVGDCNADGIPDGCEADCDGNGIPDECDLARHPELDRDANLRLDACDLACAANGDANANGVPDWTEFTAAGPYDALTLCPTGDASDGTLTFGFAADPLPAGLFAPSSAAFAGELAFTAIAIDPTSIGNASIVVQRAADPFTVKDRPGGAPVAVAAQLAGLSLGGRATFTISSDDGPLTVDAWAHAVATQLPGTLLATKTTSFGGTADLTLPMSIEFLFAVRETGACASIVRTYTLTAFAVPWVHAADAALDLAIAPRTAFVFAVDGAPGAQVSTGFSGGIIGGGVACAIHAIAYRANLTIYNGLDGHSGGQAIAEAKEESDGAVTVANLNDTDGDGIVDQADDEVKAAAMNPKGIDEIDLMKLVVDKPIGANGGAVTLERVGGSCALWGQATKKDPLALPLEIPVNQLPKTYWIESTATSGALRDIHLRSTYKKATDDVRATGAWSSKSLVKLTRAAAGAANAVPGDVDNALKTLIEGRKAADDSLYGYGTFDKQGADDTRRGGRILLEFETKPAGVEALGVRWDVTRRLEHRDWVIYYGQGTLTDDGRRDFPAQAEEPNDDGGAADEDNDPAQQHIYSFDAPSDTRASSEAFYVTRNNFVEYTRVHLANRAFANRNNLREGSRSSAYVAWHYVDYFVRGDNARRIFDTSGKKPQWSTPFQVGAGSGSCVAKLLANAKTEGFTAIYDLAARRWTLIGTSGDPAATDAKAQVPAGTQWTLTYGTKVQVTITQGATPFADGTTFDFSIFTASSAAGKTGEVAEGATTILDEGN
ncbi:MAG: hypothetical protein JNM94_09240 [Phycisphaerae bacterium]|nr:hypothetical protein [Phycisphaerae bacterium]